jgi:acyl carrier protein
MNRDEGIEIIRRAVADSLALDLDEVRAESRLITDLSADSLDFLDLIFTLEEKFSVKLREGELDFLAKLDLSSPETMNGDFLKRDVVDSLTSRLPALRDEPDLDRIKPARLYGLITIETLWLMVADHLN